MKKIAAGKSKLSLDIRTELLEGLKARAGRDAMSYTAYLERLIAQDLAADGKTGASSGDWHAYQAAYWSFLSVVYVQKLVEDRFSEAFAASLRELVDDHIEARFGYEPDRPLGVLDEDDD